MAITKISGVLWANLAKVGSIAKASITSISGVSTPPSVTCSTELFMYGRDTTEACSGMFFVPYSFDEANGVIYNYNQCGSQTGAPGFYQKYSDNIIYFFDGTSLSLVGPCKK